MNIFDILFLLLIGVAVAVAIPFFAKMAGVKNRKYLYYLWYYHLLFGIIFYIYVNANGGDALGYWRESNISFSEHFARGQGTAFMQVFNYAFVEILHLSFFTGSMIYTFIGFMGMMFFYLATMNLVKSNVKVYGINIFPYIFFLPNLHFWSAGVGKDTLSFFCIGLFLLCIMQPFKRSVGIGLSLVLAYFVRPHIAIFMLVAFGIGFMFDNKLKPAQKIVLSLGLVLGAAFIFNDVIAFLKLDEVSTESIEQFSSERASGLSREHTGSAVDISSYSLPLKIFTFLFRPLFFDARNAMSLLASIENLILLILLFKVVNLNTLKLLKNAPYQIKGLFIFFIIGSVGFSNILGNMGIMMRMKNMLIPGMLIFIFWILSKKKEMLISRYKRYRKHLADNEANEITHQTN